MCQNPANAIIHTGHANGTVSLWSPNVKEPLVKMLAHSSSIKGLAVDHTGKYMVTTGLDRKCRVWDVRMYKQLHAYSLPFGLSHVSISQRMTVACAIGNNIQEIRKQLVKGDIRIERNKEKEEMEKEIFGRGENKQSDRPKHVLDRFRK
uniref:WD_REPEATS_REGION domain-containing protein n=1 Tax=Heterorhabditis bacteriophora TaxID=37862 RepID=A0A1I7XDU8_HETBA